MFLSVEFNKFAGIAVSQIFIASAMRVADCPVYHPSRRHSFLHPAKDFPLAPNRRYIRPKGCEDLLHASRHVHARGLDIGVILHSTRAWRSEEVHNRNLQQLQPLSPESSYILYMLPTCHPIHYNTFLLEYR
jgi:hypothetical protein